MSSSSDLNEQPGTLVATGRSLMALLRAPIRGRWRPREDTNCRSLVTIALVIAALMASPAPSAPARQPARDGKEEEGKFVTFAGTDEGMVFPYYDVAYPAYREIVLRMTGSILETFKSNEVDGASLGFSKAQLEVVQNVELRASTRPALGMMSRYEAGKYLIFIPDEASYFFMMMGASLAEVSNNRDLGFVNLLMMSELDFHGNKVRRWYNPQRYAKHQNYPPAPTVGGTGVTWEGMQAYLITEVLLHEICHHSLGHTRATSKDSRSSIGNEIEADRCAARHSANIRLPPGLGLAANLSIAILMGDADTATHPISSNRIRKVAQFDRDAIDQLEARGTLKPDAAKQSREASDMFIKQLEEWRSIYQRKPLSR